MHSDTVQPAAFSKDERESLTYMFWGRSVVLGLIALWIAVTIPIERSLAYFAVIIVFFLLGAIPFWLSVKKGSGTATFALFLFLDAALLTYLLIFPNPYGLEGWSPQMNLRAPGFLYLGVFLAYMSLSYKPMLVVWAGVSAILAWCAGNFLVLARSETTFFSSADILGVGLTAEQVKDVVLDPFAMGQARWVNQVVFLAVLTLLLTLTVWRSRRLVQRRINAERQRSALSRYFSPNVVDRLAANNAGLDDGKIQPVTVLFADLVGFTTISETLSPRELIELLRDFHSRLARVALSFDGTIDKFIGDAIMVNFGTPDPRADDAERALRCAVAMIVEIDSWNVQRQAQGRPRIDISIGMEFGEVVVGNIGDARRMEFTVLGDPVNVASRLEGRSRELNAVLVVGQNLIRAVEAADADPVKIVPELKPAVPITVKGRTSKVQIWVWSRDKAHWAR